MAEQNIKQVSFLIFSTTTYQVDQARSAIVAGSNEVDFSSLTTSLNLLWNAVHVVQENGSIVLRPKISTGWKEHCKCLWRARWKSQDLYKRGFYVPGLEHLIYNLRQEFDLGILLSLPQYYLKKLGFERYTRGNDVFEKLLAKHGRKHKIVVLSAEDLTLLMLIY
jgi:hypothetical protein